MAIYEMAASPMPLESEGKTYLLSPLRLKELGIIEQELLANRPRPLDIVRDRLDGFPPHVQEALAREAFHQERVGQRATPEEVDAYCRTSQGAVLKFWLMLRREQPALTRDDAEKLLVTIGIEATLEAIARAGGKPVGNFFRPSWPTRMSRALSRGAASIAGSLGRMAGRRSKSAS